MVDCFLGEIRIFAGAYAPVNWHACDGTLMAIADNTALYSLLGNSWGGDGRTSFALPDLRCRVPVGSGEDTNKISWNMGNKGGAESVTLSTDEMPAHSHSFLVSTSAATASSPGAKQLYAVPSNTASEPDGLYTAVATRDAEMAEGVLTDTGGAGGHSNIMPVMDLYYIICTSGTYPSHAD